MMKMTTASSRRVNPGLEDWRRSLDRAGPVATRRGKRALLMIRSGRTAVYIVGALDPVGTETFERIAAAVALIEILVTPRIVGKFLDVAALLVVTGNPSTGRSADQSLQALVGGGVGTVVEIVAIEGLLQLLDVGLGLGAFGPVADPAQPRDSRRRQQSH